MIRPWSERLACAPPVGVALVSAPPPRCYRLRPDRPHHCLPILPWRLTLGLLCFLTACSCETTQSARTDIKYRDSAGSAPAADAGAGASADVSQPSILIDPDTLVALRAEGAALLDARGAVAFRVDHIPGAVHAPWDQFVSGLLNGVIDDDVVVIEAELQAMGVRADRPVLIVGDWDKGWGEEGRVFWTLEYLGHRDVRVLYGGMPRWLAEARPTESFSKDPPRGDFKVALRPELRATADFIQEGLKAEGGLVLLDARHVEEFEGATPYGEARGGHIPGAKHLFWQSIFSDEGNLKDYGVLRSEMAAAGVGGGRPTVVYCTGGVRSGFLYMVLRWLGFEGVRNYDGSWWEWSASEDLPVAP